MHPARGPGTLACVSAVLQQILAFLDTHSVAYRHVRHEPVRTSEEAAFARKEPLEIGGKALLVKVDDTFTLFVLSAARRFDSKAARRHLHARRTRFATPAELLELTTLVPGSVPPFGQPILPFPLFVDTSIVSNERIAFNAGSLTDSLVLQVVDYTRVAEPTVASFT